MKQRHGALLILLFLLRWSPVNSQGYSLVYQKDRPSMLFSSLAVDGDTAYVLGVTTKLVSPGYYIKSMMGKISLDQPDSIDYKAYVDGQAFDYGTWQNTLFWDSLSNSFIATGYLYSGKEGILFIQLDKNLAIVQLKEIYDSDTTTLSYKGMNILRYDSSYFFISGIIQHGDYNSNMLLLKIDSGGNVLLKKEYGTGSGWFEWSTSMIKLKNGNLLLGSFKAYENRPYAVSQTWLIEVDTLGMVKRQWFDPNDSTYGAYSLRQTRDGGYIYAAQKADRQTINSAYLYATVVKMDSAFNKQWTYKGGGVSLSTGIFDIEKLEDGSFVACGNTRFAYPPDYTVQSGWIMKLSPNGELLWEKHYEAFTTYGADNYLYDVDVLPDGGFIACGEAEGDDGQFGWLLKVDSTGCVIENCMVGIGEVLKPEPGEIKVYPNPAKDIVTIEFNALLENDRIDLVDICGRLIKNVRVCDSSGKIEISTSELSNGVLIALLFSEEKLKAKGKFNILK